MSQTKKVALTFDDGPNPPYTNQILTILKEKGVKATFFVCGANAEKYPEIVKKIAKEDHLLGNHTYSHNRLTTMLGTNYEEIKKTQAIIEKLTSQGEKLFRPPYGLTPSWLKRKLEKEGFQIVGAHDTGDWLPFFNAETIASRVVKSAKPGSTILLHDGRGTKTGTSRQKAVRALPLIIERLRNQNYKFVFPRDL